MAIFAYGFGCSNLYLGKSDASTHLHRDAGYAPALCGTLVKLLHDIEHWASRIMQKVVLEHTGVYFKYGCAVRVHCMLAKVAR